MCNTPPLKKSCLCAITSTLHLPAALYKTFKPEEARSLLNRLEIHHTPKHGSWLNMAEIELAALTRQCLDRRIPDLATLQAELLAWNTHRNNAQTKIDWQFTNVDARTKLKRLYPVFSD